MIACALIILLVPIAYIRAQSELACAGVPAGRFVRNSESCQSYYYCDGKRAIPNMCPSNYLYNAKTEMCDHAVNVDCTRCSEVGIQHLSDPLSCNGYLQCVNGIQSKVSCIGNLAFDHHVGDCNMQHSDSSVCYDSICSEYKEHIRVGDAKDCAYYYTCFGGKAYKKSCAPGLYFNVHMGQCQRSESFDICQGEGPIVIGYDKDYGEMTTLGPNYAENEIIPKHQLKSTIGQNKLYKYFLDAASKKNMVPATAKPYQNMFHKTDSTPSIGLTALSRHEKRFECTMADGAFTHPSICTKFIRCSNWNPQVIDCRTGYYWHQDRRRCAPQKPENC